MEQKAITQEEKTKKEIRAEEQFKRAQANLAKVRREKKEQIRQAENRHKYMMGGCVVKYFPEAYEFLEQEMNSIIACAFIFKDMQTCSRKFKVQTKEVEI